MPARGAPPKRSQPNRGSGWRSQRKPLAGGERERVGGAGGQEPGSVSVGFSQVEVLEVVEGDDQQASCSDNVGGDMVFGIGSDSLGNLAVASEEFGFGAEVDQAASQGEQAGATATRLEPDRSRPD